MTNAAPNAAGGADATPEAGRSASSPAAALLPGQVARRRPCIAGRDVFIVGFEGFAEPAVIGGYPHLIAAGRAGRIPRHLAHARLPRCGAGRPGAAPLHPRAAAGCGGRPHPGPHRPGRFPPAMTGCWRPWCGCWARKVFAVHAARMRSPGDRSRRPGLLSAFGALMRRRGPTYRARIVSVARALGKVDVGQGCVVQQGIVLSLEAIEGTDAMLARSQAVARPGPGRGAGQAGQAGPGPARGPADPGAPHRCRRGTRRACGASHSRPNGTILIERGRPMIAAADWPLPDPSVPLLALDPAEPALQLRPTLLERRATTPMTDATRLPPPPAACCTP